MPPAAGEQDNSSRYLEELLPYDRFELVVEETAVESIPAVLDAAAARLQDMQARHARQNGKKVKKGKQNCSKALAGLESSREPPGAPFCGALSNAALAMAAPILRVNPASLTLGLVNPVPVAA